MKCLLTPVRRNGVPYPRSSRPRPDRGVLEVLPSEMDRTLGRAVTMARFMGSRQFELINAELVRFVGTEMILSGLERHYTESGGSADYAQGWLIQILPG